MPEVLGVRRPARPTLPPCPALQAPPAAGPAGKTSCKTRARIGSNFSSQAELKAAKQSREVDELVPALPPEVARALLGGELGELQLPSPEERAAVLKGGGGLPGT